MLAPKIGSHIEIYQSRDKKITIFNKNTRKTFALGEKEAKVLALLDGIHTIEDIQKQCSFYSEDEIQQLISAFSEIGVFRVEKRKINLFKLKVRLFNPNKYFGSNSMFTKGLMYLIFAGGLFAFISGILAHFLWGETQSTLQIDQIIKAYTSFGITDILILLAGASLSLALHELAHTIAAKFYDVNVPEIGLMLYCLMPCAYTNISGITLLKSKKEKVVVLAAGSFVNLGIIGICYFLLDMVNNPQIMALILGLLIVNAGTIFMNCMVFMKFDGYYVLSILFEDSQLKENAILHVRQVVTMLIRDRKELKESIKNILIDSNSYLTHIVYCLYSIVSIFYVPMLIANILISIF